MIQRKMKTTNQMALKTRRKKKRKKKRKRNRQQGNAVE